MNRERLADTLYRLDGRPYPAYKDLRGTRVDLGGMELTFESIQGDPFASRADCEWMSLPEDGSSHLGQSTGSERLATADFLHRAIRRKLGGRRAADGSGRQIGVLGVGQRILERSAVTVLPGGTVRCLFTVGLPASGRRIRGRAAADLLTERIPDAFEDVFTELRLEELRHHIHCLEDQLALRTALEEHSLVAFIANQSMLAGSGVDDRPLSDAIPFESPPSLEVELKPLIAEPSVEWGFHGNHIDCGEGATTESRLSSRPWRSVYNHVPEMDGTRLLPTRTRSGFEQRMGEVSGELICVHSSRICPWDGIRPRFRRRMRAGALLKQREPSRVWKWVPGPY